MAVGSFQLTALKTFDDQSFRVINQLIDPNPILFMLYECCSYSCHEMEPETQQIKPKHSLCGTFRVTKRLRLSVCVCAEFLMTMEVDGYPGGDETVDVPA